MAHRKIEDLDRAIEHASLLRRMLQDTISHECPKLVERGIEVLAGSGTTSAAAHRVRDLMGRADP